ncbi:hypothetical protein [Alienimonas chondri]|uniref:Uncharacterized protein n=1 Tax=Alienimonas chondri TaxID=2681879 RepID=A0ABX1VHY5_9PLAN|nr:hypothetical protein [Alienimonas chondri]NNJ27125.1 hypothetical protein [Alienimonas chondri]
MSDAAPFEFLFESEDGGPFKPVPLTNEQRTAVVRALSAGAAPQKACADAGVEPLHFFAALAEDAELAVQLGRLDAMRSLNVLAVTYQKALSGASADRSLYLKFRPPPPAVPTDEETVELNGPIGETPEEELGEQLNA